MSQVITRFAPSPTGYLHIGGARTALFNWLYARHHGGKFILRIEDTDRERSTKESIDAILEGMAWLGLDWDEGPHYQSKRTEIYLEHIEKMLKEGKAYRCCCTQEELSEKRAKAMDEGRKPKYDGTCRNRTDVPEDKPFTIRFKAPQSGTTAVDDMIKGRVAFDNSELDDLIIARSDGSPTYNFVVVVDDAAMGITHIIRGDDHLNNTPRQILLYKALGYSPPVFGHLPLILGEDKKRLSKRHGATSVMAYKDMGYLSEALINYLARLGWSHGDQEIFSTKELIEYFDTDSIGKSAGVFNPDKLLWLNSHYIKETPDGEMAEMLAPLIEKRGCNLSAGPPVTAIIPFLKERGKTLVEMAQLAEFYYIDEVKFDEKAKEKALKTESAHMLKNVADGLEKLGHFSEEGLEIFFKKVAEEEGLKFGKIAQPVRFAITGGTASPGLYEVISLLGREKTVKRIRKALEEI